MDTTDFLEVTPVDLVKRCISGEICRKFGYGTAVDKNGKTVQVVGGDQSLGPYWSRVAQLADPEGDLRILLFHFPDVVRHLPPGAFDLVLAGHLHGGQICIPTPRGKVRLEHLRAPHWEGLHDTPAGTLHVSRGLGTSFVPFRFLARPEATRLVLRSAAH